MPTKYVLQARRGQIVASFYRCSTLHRGLRINNEISRSPKGLYVEEGAGMVVYGSEMVCWLIYCDTQ